MKTIEQNVNVVLLIMLYKVVLNLSLVDETLVKAIEQYFHVVLFIMLQGCSNFIYSQYTSNTWLAGSREAGMGAGLTIFGMRGQSHWFNWHLIHFYIHQFNNVYILATVAIVFISFFIYDCNVVVLVIFHVVLQARYRATL